MKRFKCLFSNVFSAINSFIYNFGSAEGHASDMFGGTETVDVKKMTEMIASANKYFKSLSAEKTAELTEKMIREDMAKKFIGALGMGAAERFKKTYDIVKKKEDGREFFQVVEKGDEPDPVEPIDGPGQQSTIEPDPVLPIREAQKKGGEVLQVAQGKAERERLANMTMEQKKAEFCPNGIVEFGENKIAEKLVGLHDLFSSQFLNVIKGDNKILAELKNEKYYDQEGKRVYIYSGDLAAPMDDELGKQAKADLSKEKVGKGRSFMERKLRNNGEALFAFNQAYEGNEVIKNKIKELVAGKNVNNSETWVMVHNELLHESEYLTAMEKQEKDHSFFALAERYKELDKRYIAIQEEMNEIDGKLRPKQGNVFHLINPELSSRLSNLEEEFDHLGVEHLKIQELLVNEFKKKNPGLDENEFLASITKTSDDLESPDLPSHTVSSEGIPILPLVDLEGNEIPNTGLKSDDDLTLASAD